MIEPREGHRLLCRVWRISDAKCRMMTRSFAPAGKSDAGWGIG
jgi:hypothetical protein